MVVAMPLVPQTQVAHALVSAGHGGRVSVHPMLARQLRPDGAALSGPAQGVDAVTAPRREWAVTVLVVVGFFAVVEGARLLWNLLDP